MKTPIRAIRAYCLGCSNGSSREVRLCPLSDCPLYPYRFGKRPMNRNTDDYPQDSQLLLGSGGGVYIDTQETINGENPLASPSENEGRDYSNCYMPETHRSI